MKRRSLLVLVVALVLIAAGGTYAYKNFHQGRRFQPQRSYYSQQPPINRASTTLDHVVILLEENKPQDRIIGGTDAPYINSLVKKYATASNYYAITNPSLPNYLALTSGTTAGITNDCNPSGGSCEANVTNIADRLERANKTWKEYAESMPQPCYANNSGEYAVKHNPFMYYPDVSGNTTRCHTHIVPFSRFAADLTTENSLPNYAFITPNLCNDMHDCSIQIGDTWLAQQVPKILGSPAFTQQNSLLVITWDEGNSANNNVPIIFAGPAAKQNYISTIYYSHYSLLHEIESGWKLAPLTQNDANAPLMTDMLR